MEMALNSNLRCSVVNCGNVPAEGKWFFKFPIDFNLCMQWVQNTGNDQLWQEFQYQGALPFIHKQVCSEHFLDIDFLVFGQPRKGLRSDAVPFSTTIKAEPLNPLEMTSAKKLEEILKTPVPAEENNPKLQFFQQLNILQKGLDTNKSDTRSLLNLDEKSITIKTELNEEGKITTGDGLMNLLYMNSLAKRRNGASRSPQAIQRAEQRKNESPEQRAIRLEKNRERALVRRLKESEEQTIVRRQKCAERISRVRAKETEEQREKRRERCRIRQAEKRKNMTPEEREIWKMKNRIQTRERRQREDEVKKMIRRYNNALRASIKRSNETEEQKMQRRYRDAIRTAEKRKTESSDEREERLRRDRERIRRKRWEIKIKETPEERMERLRKDRERHSNKRIHNSQTLYILGSISEYLSMNQMDKNQITPENMGILVEFLKSSYPDVEVCDLENAVECAVFGEAPNENTFDEGRDSFEQVETEFGVSQSESSCDTSQNQPFENSLLQVEFREKPHPSKEKVKKPHISVVESSTS